MSKDVFWQRMADESPGLRVQFHDEEPRIVEVRHTLYSAPDASSLASLPALTEHPGGGEIGAFYAEHDGLEFCSTLDVRYGEILSLVEFFPLAKIPTLTARYQPGGDRAWTIDYNKSRNLYRREHDRSWIVFAIVDDGPLAFALFLDGEHAGHVFLIAPQPRFNILKPIAKGFDALLQRMGKDPAAFLRLVGAYVCLHGDEQILKGRPPNQPNHYGFKAVAYLSDREKQ